MTSRPYLSDATRRLVSERAQNRCEYCLISEQDTILGCAIDHIISLKHGGSNEPENLAYACVFCNRYKGSDVGSVILETKEFVRFYNPRDDRWSEHFRLDEATIIAKTSIGEVTTRILGFNDERRIVERQILIAKGRYAVP
ncbi:MAG: HNH endonuclease [Spirulinaceae cyanobacterium]